MNHDLRIVAAFKRELSDWRLWVARAVVIAVAIAAGLTVVAFTWMTEHALGLFRAARTSCWWLPLIATPLISDTMLLACRRDHALAKKRRVAWADLRHLQFPKWSAARAVTNLGDKVPLPAVGFQDLPIISVRSGGRVPDPFAAYEESLRDEEQ